MMYEAKGNTYPAREVLKTAGFEWDAKKKIWTGNEEAKKEFERITTPTYSRRNMNTMYDRKSNLTLFIVEINN